MTPAKDLFGQGKYGAAEKAFLTAAKNAQSSVDQSLQLSNASQCVLKISQYERAAQHALEAIILNPRNAKAHYRLASAYAAMPLPQQAIDAARRRCDIAMANARAFALIKAAGGNNLPNVVGLELVSCDENPISTCAAELLRYISDSKVVLVTRTQDILDCAGVVAVLETNCQMPLGEFSLPAHIVGLDGSALIDASNAPHALFLQRGNLAVWSLRFKGALGAMIVTTSYLTLVDCSINDHIEDCILVTDPTSTALIAFCTFSNCTVGVEVREGASATIVRSKIQNMSKSGVSAYGGARSIVLEETLVENAGIEGVQCLGPRAPATFDEYNLEESFRKLRENSLACATADIAMDSARGNVDSAQLVVILRNCCVRGCGKNRSQIVSSGVTIDQSAKAMIQGCLFTRCVMADVYIKGGCDVSIQYCRFDHGNAGDAGVRVDVNYEGKVNIEHSVFVGKPARAIVDSVSSAPPELRARMGAMGARNIPINKFMVKTVSLARNASGIERLREDMKRADIRSEVQPGVPNHADTDRISSSNNETPGGAGALYRLLGKQHFWTDYPIGNTYGTDVLRYADSKNLKKNEVIVVLAACGDIRNVVETICGLEKKQLKKVCFSLNDISISILARNITLLELACRLWPKEENVRANSRKRAARIWLHVWGSIALTLGDHTALLKVLADLIKGKLPNWLSPLDAHVRAALTCCWSEWASCKRTLREVREERDTFSVSAAWYKNNVGNVTEMLAALAAGLKDSESSALLNKAELLNGGGEKVNPTLLAPGLHYKMYESSIFRSIDMRAFIQGDVTRLHSAACDVMNEKGPIVARALRSGALRIEVQPGDLTFVLRSQREVDVVELSNALDYISKPACLISAARCLARPGGILLMHTMIARTLDQDMQILRKDLDEHLLRGSSREDLVELFDLCTVVEESDATDSYGDGINTGARWVYQAKSYESFDTQERERLRMSMMKAAKRWCGGVKPVGLSCKIGYPIAAWPSAVAALHVVTAAMRSTEFHARDVVKEMCNASRAISLFKLELYAHAMIMDGNEADLLVATLTLPGLHTHPVLGFHRHQILQLGFNLGQANEETVWLFDVFECSPSRGVCEVIVRKKDIFLMRPFSARLCHVDLNDGVMKGATQSVNLIRSSTLKTRELSDSETIAMRKAIVL
ncbi:unnamed protein product [Agarophyton chilense]